MPVCKFFLQGSCRYGDKCFNEHPRGGNDGGNQRYKDGSEQGYGEYGYHSPMSRGHQSQGNRYNRGDYYDNRSKSQYFDGGDKRGGQTKQDKYHWSRENQNRFAPLQNESRETRPEAGVDAIVTTVKTDMKCWAESKMWPFSCYSYTKETRCLEGLPDISPEELRVLAYLHPTEYQSIVSEIEITYSRRKDELFEMPEHIKADVLSLQNISIDSNPSADLKILSLYGPQYNFSKTESQEGSKPSPNTDAPFTFKIPDNPSQPSQENMFAVPSTNTNASSFAAAATSNQPVASTGAKISVFGTSSASNSIGSSSQSTNIYTNEDLLTNKEKKQFESDRFTIGQIPTRPPSRRFCR